MADRLIPQSPQTTEQKFIRLQELRKKQRVFELQRKEAGVGDLAEEPSLGINPDVPSRSPFDIQVIDPNTKLPLDPQPVREPPFESPVQEPEERFPTGAVVLGTVGTVAGTPFGPPGMAAGASIGSAGGEAIQQIIEQIMSDPNAPKTSEEAFKRIAKEGVFGLVAESGAGGVVRTLRGGKNIALSPFGGSLTPEDLAAREAFEKLGIQPTPFEITQRTFLGRIEQFASKGLISGGIFKRFNNKRINLLGAFQKRFLEKTGPSKVMSELGEFAKSSFDDTIKILDNEAGRLFDEAEKLAGESNIIPTDALKAAAKAVLGQEGLVVKGLQFRPLQALAQQISKLPAKISFKQARELQKRLGAKTAKLKNLPEGEMKQLFKGISESIESAEFKGQAEGAESLLKLREAKDRFIELIKLQESTIGKRITGKDPEDIFRSILQTGDVTNIKALRSVIGERDWPLFQRAFVDDLLSRGNLENFNQVLDKQQLESLQQVFSNEQIQVLQDIATAAERFRPGALIEQQRKPLGFNLVNIAQGGLAINLVLGDRGVQVSPLTQGLVILTPAMIAKLLTNPTSVKWLTIGLRLKNNHPLATQVMENITDVLVGTASRAIAAEPKTRGRFIKQFKDSGLPVEIFFPDVQRPDGTFKNLEDFQNTITGNQR